MSEADGIGMCGKHDGDRICRSTRGLNLSGRSREDQVDLHAHQLGRKLGQLLDAFRPAELDGDVLACDVTEIAQARSECLYPIFPANWGAETEKADTPAFRLLLRAPLAANPRQRRRAKQ